MTTSQSPIISVKNGVTVIELTEEHKNLNESHVEELSVCMLELAESIDSPLMVLDLTHVDFFGSSFIEVLFRVWNRLNKREGGEFCICGLSPYCQEVIEVTHLDRLWSVYTAQQEAVNALSAKSD